MTVRKGAAATKLRATKPLRTFRDVARANYDLAVRDMDPNAHEKLETVSPKFRRRSSTSLERELRASRRRGEENAQDKIAEFTGQEIDAKKAKKELAD